jgi:hypothetical protein
MIPASTGSGSSSRAHAGATDGRSGTCRVDEQHCLAAVPIVVRSVTRPLMSSVIALRRMRSQRPVPRALAETA